MRTTGWGWGRVLKKLRVFKKEDAVFARCGHAKSVSELLMDTHLAVIRCFEGKQGSAM